jgi:transcription initiation factor TFIIIB Brf1 subunit/transcription initiation factor TFIIB
MNLDELMVCPDCGSKNIEQDSPRPGEHTCRDCGGWLDFDTEGLE